MEISGLGYFLAASVLLTLAPGPDNMYLLTKSLADGARTGIVLAAGLVSGILFHTCLVVFGVAAFIQSTPAAFLALKYLGAAYLLFLAWKAFRSAGNIRLQAAGVRLGYGAVYRRGVLMNALNPKVLLFFLAFLPQFVALESHSAGWQIAFLGFCFALQAFLIFSALAVCAGRVRKLILRRKNLGKLLGRTEGIVLALIAAALLLE